MERSKLDSSFYIENENNLLQKEAEIILLENQNKIKKELNLNEIKLIDLKGEILF